MKKLFTIMLLMFSLTLVSCQTENDINGDDNGNDNNNNTPNTGEPIQLLTDNHFETGFNLLGISPVEDGRDVKKWLDYGGEAKEQAENPWVMAQWWTPHDVVNASFEKVNGTYIYETPSRTIKINPEDDGYLYFELRTEEEYPNGPRELGEPWTHLLIEQDFNTSVKMSQLDKLIMGLELSVLEVENLMGSDYNPDKHAAQFLWYITLRNVLPEGADESELGQNGDFIWFGIPIYDNRSDFVKQSAHLDTGGPGTTSKLIYSMSSQNYFNEPLVMGKKYTINIDILPFVKEAFVYAINNNVMKNTKFENIEIGYMNFGWEVPGTFNVKSEIRNMSIEAILKGN